MSRRERRERRARGPASSAGLLRFYEEESYGFKISPYLVAALAIILITVVTLANVFGPKTFTP